jgi:preprotein translocase subunit SecF
MLNFMKYRYLYFVISLLFLIPGIFSLVRYGLQPSIDFAGGALIEVDFVEPVELVPAEVVSLVSQAIPLQSVQSSGDNQYLLRGPVMSNDDKNLVIQILESEYGALEELRFEAVGPTLSRELLSKTLVAVMLVAGIITFYIARQFHELRFGVATIMAMAHDAMILLGAFSLFGVLYGVQVDMLFVTALLTTLAFSVHDTIVVFDRIRELRQREPRIPMIDVTNAAMTQTLGRSLNNSITTIIVLTSLSLLGGETIRWFSIALLIGIVTGTYSSPFTAAPLLIVWEDLKSWHKNRRSS